jgi:hypothetical protein
MMAHITWPVVIIHDADLVRLRVLDSNGLHPKIKDSSICVLGSTYFIHTSHHVDI